MTQQVIDTGKPRTNTVIGHKTEIKARCRYHLSKKCRHAKWPLSIRLTGALIKRAITGYARGFLKAVHPVLMTGCFLVLSRVCNHVFSAMLCLSWLCS